ncbi:MAG: hypothetical protein KDE35_08410 [Geminicoccaceae bacterium]|nr:hypothetical protein [Geminicoccaceae bacterium]
MSPPTSIRSASIPPIPISWIRSGALVAAVLATSVCATAGERLPEPVRVALSKEPHYRHDEVEGIFTRRPAPTKAGFMYEVVLQGVAGERIVYIDPDMAVVIFVAGSGAGDAGGGQAASSSPGRAEAQGAD